MEKSPSTTLPLTSQKMVKKLPMWTFTRITDHSLELQKSNSLENMGNVFAVVTTCTNKMTHALTRKLHVKTVEYQVTFLPFVQDKI